MADGDIKISQLTSHNITGDEQIPFAYPDPNVSGGMATGKGATSALGSAIVKDLAYPTSGLKTSQKTIVGAINQTIGNFADEYDATQTYDEGDCVLYGGLLYQANTDITVAEAWDSTHWTQVKAVDVGAGGGAIDDTTVSPDTTWSSKKIDETKADKNGLYEDLGAGKLITPIVVSDKSPYNFRTSGGSLDIGDRMNVKSIVGGTFAFNQLVQNGNFANTSNWTTYGSCSYTVSDNVGDVTFNNGRLINVLTVPQNHKVLVSFSYKTTANNCYVLLGNDTVGSLLVSLGTLSSANNFTNFSKIIAPSGEVKSFAIRNNGSANIQLMNVMCIDLTAMFGSTIADYIYSLEQSVSGSGVAWFRKYFPKSYYAYNSGSLMSVKTSKHITTGFNQWDEEWEVGNISVTTGKNSTDNQCIRSKNYIPIVPSTVYYCMRDLSKNYSNVRFCEYDADKNFIQAPDSVSNATITFSSNARYVRFYTRCTSTPYSYRGGICINLSWDGERNGEYEPYVKHEYALDSDLELRGIPKLDSSNNLYYDGDTYESDGTVTRKYEYRDYASGDESLPDTITDGTHTVTKLTTPTTETADEYTAIEVVDDFGTEEFVDNREVAIPVGHETEYSRYQEFEVPAAPTTNGTYALKVTVSGTKDKRLEFKWV